MVWSRFLGFAETIVATNGRKTRCEGRKRPPKPPPNLLLKSDAEVQNQILSIMS
jgi:hypothetical protein